MWSTDNTMLPTQLKSLCITGPSLWANIHEVLSMEFYGKCTVGGQVT